MIETPASVLLIIPWWKKAYMKGDLAPNVEVIYEFQKVPKGLVEAIMVDVDLKDHWAEGLDKWFHVEVLPVLDRSTGYVVWCKEHEKSEDTDATTG